MTFPTSLTDEAREHFEHREEIGAVNALRWFFNPRAVAERSFVWELPLKP